VLSEGLLHCEEGPPIPLAQRAQRGGVAAAQPRPPSAAHRHSISSPSATDAPPLLTPSCTLSFSQCCALKRLRLPFSPCRQVHLRRRGADSRLRISEDGLALALTGSTPSVVGQTSDGRTLLSRSVMLPRKVIHPDEITSCVNELGQITISVPASALEPSVPNPAPTPAQAQAKPGWSRSPSGKPLGKSFSRISASAVNAKKVAPVAKTAAEPAQKSAPDGLRSDQMSSDQKIGESDDGLVDLTDAFAVEEEKQVRSLTSRLTSLTSCLFHVVCADLAPLSHSLGTSMRSSAWRKW